MKQSRLVRALCDSARTMRLSVCLRTRHLALALLRDRRVNLGTPERKAFDTLAYDLARACHEAQVVDCPQVRRNCGRASSRAPDRGHRATMDVNAKR